VGREVAGLDRKASGDAPNVESPLSDTSLPPSRLDAADIQRRLAIGPRRLFQLIAEGRFPEPDLRVGKTGRRLWDAATVEAWELSQRDAARSDS
jgi:hypothetical protein